LLVVAPVGPNSNVLVTDIAALMFDVPVNVKFVAVAIDRTVDATVVVVRTIDPVVPKAIERVVLLDEINPPVVKVKLFRSNVPAVNEDMPVIEHVKASCSVVVIPEPLTVNVSITLPFDVSVPLPTVKKSVLV
jgi:hypothetical protein